MKIYLSGTHGSGKTTLARYISEKYNLPLIPEVARIILSEKELQLDSLRHDMNLVDDYQSQVFYRQLIEETKYDDFVSDRSAIDNLAYSAQHSRILPRLMQSSELQTYLSNLKDSNSIVFFVRAAKATLKADGVRESINWDGAVAIDAQIKLLYEMYEIRYFQIDTESMQERIKIIDNILSLIR